MAQLDIVFKNYKKYAPQSAKIFCYHTGDYIEQVNENFRHQNLLTFNYNKYDRKKNVYAIPDFIFYNWKEANLIDYYDFYNNMTSQNITKKIFDEKQEILFWVGNIYTNLVRIQCHEKYKDHEFIKIVHPVKSGQSLTLQEHGNYKYLLDISGYGWSGRLKYLLLLKSVVFIVDRGSVEWWDDQFIPWIHYVPVKSDASDLELQLEKVRNNQTLAFSIAQQGYQQALNVFSKDNVYMYYAKVLNEYPGGEL